ncbi:hypothetical protein CDD82_2994 [Ophiocordyceps australis]|uniref:tetrahydrofolate synthase n=1 Tax=Ophiocordyceps australis TaxID=1399860 RepID=A0A2C5ZTN2_9HYPO|nr:hypothetical protein CDD82_2994 [Ophiocordyceps australis]
METWLKRAGYTTEDLARMRHIHVAGSRGKGSVCTLATSMLVRHRASSGGSSSKESKVGTYTSPHLISPRERIAINGKPVSQAVFAEAFFELWDRFTKAAINEGMSASDAETATSKPYFFRFLTIMAWHVFLKHGISDVVMEVGIGGEYDSTNVLPPEAVSVSVITPIMYDHITMLGGSRAEIAWHKAGIFKPGVRAFTCVDSESKQVTKAIQDVLISRAKEKGTDLTMVPSQKGLNTKDNTGAIKPDIRKFKHSFNGALQVLAIMAVREHLGLKSDTMTVSEALQEMPPAVIQGFEEAQIRGVFEVIEEKDIIWLLDAAHSTGSVRIMGPWIQEILKSPDEQVILVFSQQVRETKAILTSLVRSMKDFLKRKNVLNTIILARNDVEGQAKNVEREDALKTFLGKTSGKLHEGCIIEARKNMADAIMSARKAAAAMKNGNTKPKVLITGGHRCVGAALRVLEPESLS